MFNKTTITKLPGYKGGTHFTQDTSYLQHNFFIITNLIHKFLVHSHKLHKIKFLYTFQAQSAHQDVDDANYTYAASGIVTLCK